MPRPSEEFDDLVAEFSDSETGGRLFQDQLVRNRKTNEEILRQRTQGKIASEIVGGMVGGGLGGRWAKNLAIGGAKKLAARSVASGIGSAVTGGGFNAPEDNALTEAAESFGRGAAGEVFGAGAERFVLKPLGKVAVAGAKKVPGLRRIVEPFKKSLEPSAEQSLQTLQSRGVTPTAGQLVDNPLLDEMENIAEASAFGGIRVRNVRKGAEDKATQLISDFVESAKKVAGPEEMGQLAQEALENSGKMHAKAVRGAARGLERKYGGNTPIKIGAVKGLAERLEGRLTVGLKKQSSQVEGIVSDVLKRETVPGLSEDLPALTRVVSTRGDTIPLTEALALRSDLLAVERAAGDVLPAKTQALAAGLAKVLDRRIAEGLRSTHGDAALVAYRQFFNLVKTGKTGFNNRVMKQIIGESDPETIFNTIVRPGNSSRIRNIRGKIEGAISAGKADPDTWKAVQGNFYDTTLRRAVDPETGTVSGKRILAEIKRYGPETLEELFPNGGIKEFEHYARTLAFTQKKAGPGATFAIALKLAQFGAVVDLGSSLFGGEGVPGFGDTRSKAIILGPYAMSYLFTDPAAVRWLTIGATTPAGTRLASRAAGQLLSRIDEIMPSGAATLVSDPEETATPTAGVPSIQNLVPRGVR